MATGPPLNTASSNAPSQSSSSLVDDNPCWGGPTLDRHNLDYLLRVLGSSTSNITAASCSVVEPSSFSPETRLQRVIDRVILYQDTNYIVVSKPPVMSWPSTRSTYHGSVIMGETHPPPQHVPPQTYMGKKAARDAERRALAMQHNQGRIIIKGK
jgi:23S rRNA-/tRNA-specific pseudouridylate synthase